MSNSLQVVEFKNDVAQFIRNMIHPIKPMDIRYENGIVIIHGRDANSRAMMIGRERQNINHLSSIVKRYFDVKEIRVV